MSANVERHRRVMALFDEACGIPVEQREAFVNERCGDDQETRAHLRALLAQDRMPRGPIAADAAGAQLLAAHIARHDPVPSGAPVPLPRIGLINRALRGDIETIVAKAMEKDKQRRYAAACDLAEDLRRYLGDEPILARPASALYQLGKLARRHRTAMAGLEVWLASMRPNATCAPRSSSVVHSSDPSIPT